MNRRSRSTEIHFRSLRVVEENVDIATRIKVVTPGRTKISYTIKYDLSSIHKHKIIFDNIYTKTYWRKFIEILLPNLITLLIILATLFGLTLSLSSKILKTVSWILASCIGLLTCILATHETTVKNMITKAMIIEAATTWVTDTVFHVEKEEEWEQFLSRVKQS